MNILEGLYILPILLFSVVIHELSHGWMALKLGDPTARDLGRLTLNPIPHIDLVGSIIVPLLSIAVSGRVFIAWAKPVPVNPANFSNVRRDDILVSIVGPLSNLVIALFCTIMFIGVALVSPESAPGNEVFDEVSKFLLRMFYGGIVLNIILALFNMIPVPPLDGSHVLASILPDKYAQKFRSIGFFGIFLLLMLLQWGPFVQVFYSLIDTLMYPFEFLINLFI